MPVDPRGVPIHGGTPQWRGSTPFRRVIVEEIIGNEVMVRDLGTGSTFSAQAITPSGRAPRPGDIWILSSELGSWTFHKMVDQAALGQPTATTEAMMAELDARNEIRWRPFDNPRSASVEVPQGAYIGERRQFEVAPNERWLLMDGSNRSRHRYRALFEVIGETYGPGDGLTTFTLPSQDDAFTSDSIRLADYQKISVSGGVDPVVTTTLTNIPGLTYSIIIPAAEPASNFQVEVIATIALDNVYAAVGLPDSEAVLRVNGSTHIDSGFSHSMLFRPVSNGLITVTGTWRVGFATTGTHTMTIAINKADATGTVTVVRQNSYMTTKLFRAGGGVSVSGSAQWYICAE